MFNNVISFSHQFPDAPVPPCMVVYIVYIEISAFATKDSGQYTSTDQNKTITAGC
jgi:hypothetical protein